MDCSITRSLDKFAHNFTHLNQNVHQKFLINCLIYSAYLELLVIYKSDNGREFVNSVITELNGVWVGLKLMHG